MDWRDWIFRLDGPLWIHGGDRVHGIHGVDWMVGDYRVDRCHKHQHGVDWRLGRDRMVWIFRRIWVDRMDR